MKSSRTILLCCLLSTCFVLKADVPGYWLQAPDAYRMPKYSSLQLNWHDIKISDLPKECIVAMQSKIKSLRLAKFDLNSDGINELIVNVRPATQSSSTYYIFMKKKLDYGPSAPKQYYKLYYRGIRGEQLIILEPKNGFCQLYVNLHSGERYKFFQVYSMQQGGPDYVMSRKETHDFNKFHSKIERGKLWGDYPDEMFTAALEQALRITIKKHYLDKIRQEDLKFSKSKETFFRCEGKIENITVFLLVYAKPGRKYKLKTGKVCREFKINSKRSLYYFYRQHQEYKAITDGIKNFLKSYQYVSFVDRLADEINGWYRAKDYLGVMWRFDYFMKHYPTNRKLPKLLFKTVDAAIEYNKKSDYLYGKYWRVERYLHHALKYLSGNDRAKALYRMWNIQRAINTAESLKLATSYRRKINREYPPWKWHQPPLTMPLRTSKLYNPTVIVKQKIGKAATLERLKFDYAPGKSAEFLVISIPFSNKIDYLTALGKPAISKPTPQIASILTSPYSISFAPRQVSMPAQRKGDGVYYGIGFNHGLPRVSLPDYSFPSHYLGIGLTPDNNLYFFILDPVKTPKELPAFNEFQNMLLRRYPLESLIFVMSRTFSSHIENKFVELVKHLLAGRNIDIMKANRKTP